MKIIFAGTPLFAVPALKALLDSSHEVIAVLTQPDRPAGRGQQLQASPVKALAMTHDIPVYQPTTLRDIEIHTLLRELNADVMVVVAYGLILPQAVLDIPRYGCINIHPSLLPRWRGAAPIQRTIAAGDAETAVTIMQMDKGMDTGPILLQDKVVLTGEETSGDLHDLCSERGAALLLSVLDNIDHIKPIAQSSEGITHAAKLEKAESVIDWQKSTKEILCQIRAMNPWPIAQMHYREMSLKIYAAKFYSHDIKEKKQGILFVEDEKLCVAASDGIIEILSLQLPGKKIMSAKDFMHGYIRA